MVELSKDVVLHDLAAYLSSSCKSIGPTIASRVVSTFEVNTIDVIENSPQKLSSIKGIAGYRVQAIIEGWKRPFGIKLVCSILRQKA